MPKPTKANKESLSVAYYSGRLWKTARSTFYSGAGLTKWGKGGLEVGGGIVPACDPDRLLPIGVWWRFGRGEQWEPERAMGDVLFEAPPVPCSLRWFRPDHSIFWKAISLGVCSSRALQYSRQLFQTRNWILKIQIHLKNLIQTWCFFKEIPAKSRIYCFHEHTDFKEFLIILKREANIVDVIGMFLMCNVHSLQWPQHTSINTLLFPPKLINDISWLCQENYSQDWMWSASNNEKVHQGDLQSLGLVLKWMAVMPDF